MKPRELDRQLRAAGWQLERGHGKGSHRAYVYPGRSGTIIVPWHEGKDIKPGVLMRILKAAGLK
jgi:predicted RNA binding protein YcfA (HicA-like mRNA interferase family)